MVIIFTRKDLNFSSAGLPFNEIDLQHIKIERKHVELASLVFFVDEDKVRIFKAKYPIPKIKLDIITSSAIRFGRYDNLQTIHRSYKDWYYGQQWKTA